MEFSEIKPFVRFARIQHIDEISPSPVYTPVDCRLFYVLEGKGKIKTKDEIYAMNKGDVLVINSGNSYQQVIEGKMKYLAVNFDYTFNFRTRSIPIPPSEGEADVLENVEFTDVPALNSYLYRTDMFSIQQNLKEILDEYTKKLPYFELVSSSLMSSVLSEIIRDYSEVTDKGRRLNIGEIVLYIQDHYKENLTNKELSEIFHFHPNYINEVFRKRLGKSLHQYIMDVRVSKAISMLESGRMSISEIASETGFYDSCYFSRYFKKVTGVSPKVYK